MNTYLDRLGNTIFLTFNPAEFENPGHVLILPFFQEKLVFMRHRERGIELPGGKIELGETPLAAAVREVYEETGASLSEIELIGQYIVNMPNGRMVKAIYSAMVEQIHPIPSVTDTLGAVIFDQIPIEVNNHPEFSLYMKDEVYPATLRHLGLL